MSKQISEIEKVSGEILESIVRGGIKPIKELQDRFIIRSVDEDHGNPSGSVSVNSINLDALGKQTISDVCTRYLLNNSEAGVFTIVMERCYKTRVQNLEQFKAMLQERLQNNLLFVFLGNEDDHPTRRGGALELRLASVPIRQLKVIFAPNNLASLAREKFRDSQIISVGPKRTEITVSRHVKEKIEMDSTDYDRRAGLVSEFSVPNYEDALIDYLQTTADKILMFHVVRLPTRLDLDYKQYGQLSFGERYLYQYVYFRENEREPVFPYRELAKQQAEIEGQRSHVMVPAATAAAAASISLADRATNAAENRTIRAYP